MSFFLVMITTLGIFFRCTCPDIQISSLNSNIASNLNG